jgi:uncharacterized protein (TIGR03086 family)
MEMLDALSRTFDHGTTIVGGVTPDQLDAPTPCRDWDVRALLGHTMGVVVNIGNGAAGEELLADLNALPLETDLQAQFRREADRTLAAWTKRGLEGEVDIGAGPMSAEVGLRINLLDTATHTWDLARATGQDADLPDEIAATLLEVSHVVVTDDIRSFGGFDAALPVDATASPTDQLAAYLGRHP